MPASSHDQCRRAVIYRTANNAAIADTWVWPKTVQMSQSDGGKNDLPLLPDNLYVFANKQLVQGHDVGSLAPGEFPRYVRWDEPTEPADSGWVLFVGDETQADADDPSNFQINAVGTVRAVHPQLRQLLRSGMSGEWEWSDATRLYLQLPPE